eukprot:6108897-Pyramimonas_sp.AAC.1
MLVEDLEQRLEGALGLQLIQVDVLRSLRGLTLQRVHDQERALADSGGAALPAAAFEDLQLSAKDSVAVGLEQL